MLSHRRCSLRKCVLRNFAKFTGKHLCQSLRPATLLKKETLAQMFSCEFCEISKIAFFHRAPLGASATVQINFIRFSTITKIIIWILGKVEVINIVTITVNFGIFITFFIIIIYPQIKCEIFVISIIPFAYMIELITCNNFDINFTTLYIIR